ncbi:MAG: LemA family protein [Spirochaetaceae bacterium]|nr:MAG: LemA family protein [Spirochaetaceae bacterium]
MSKKAKTVAIVAVILVLSGWLVSQRNALVTLDESVDAAWSEVDNQLQRRSDLIPNLVNTVQGFMEQERQIFADIANARARLAGAGTVGETAESYEELQGALSRLLVVVENYPVLQSNQNFIRLQDELAGTENRIAVARNRYNDTVRRYNTRIRQFPASMLASRFGLEQREYFEISERAREVPQVQFGD